MEFEFATASRIIFGNGSIGKLDSVLPPFGNRCLLIVGKQNPDPEIILGKLKTLEISSTIVHIEHEPEVKDIERTIVAGRKNKCEFVIGFGGGSVIDAGKAAAAMLNNSGELLDYLEVVGKGQPLSHPSKPYVAIPTTAGTGSEVTRNAVISVPEHKVKVSMRHKYLLPEIALIDPLLTLSVPKSITASTGMDAFIQVIEPFLTRISNPFVDMLCARAIPLGRKNLMACYDDGGNIGARENMAFVSLMGGLALANAKLGAVHGFAGPIGGMFAAPHGAICAALLPAVMEVNANLLKTRTAEAEKINRFEQVARWITGDESASILDGVEAIIALSDYLNIPSLSNYGINENDFPAIIEKAKRSSSMKGNPVLLSEDEMSLILRKSL
jgi:alcohol dehydrogenase class IV